MFCRGCDYPLLQIEADRCPECGRGFDRADPTTFHARPSKPGLRRRRWIRVILVLGVIYVGSYAVLSRWGAARNESYNAKGFCYVPFEWADTVQGWTRAETVASAAFAPLEWIDANLFGGPGHASLPMRGVATARPKSPRLGGCFIVPPTIVLLDGMRDDRCIARNADIR